MHTDRKLRATAAYLLRVLQLQWPGLLQRAMMRLRCETATDRSYTDADATPTTSTDADATPTTPTVSPHAPPLMPPFPPHPPYLPPHASPLTPPYPPHPPASPLAAAVPTTLHATCPYGGQEMEGQLASVSVLALVVLLLLPLLLARQLRRIHRHRHSMTPWARRGYGQLYGEYVPTAYLWEALIALRFAALSAATAAMPEHPEVQVATCLLVLAAVGGLRLSWRPHLVRAYGLLCHMHDGLLCALVLVVLLAQSRDDELTGQLGRLAPQLGECVTYAVRHQATSEGLSPTTPHSIRPIRPTPHSPLPTPRPVPLRPSAFSPHRHRHPSSLTHTSHLSPLTLASRLSPLTAHSHLSPRTLTLTPHPHPSPFSLRPLPSPSPSPTVGSGYSMRLPPQWAPRACATSTPRSSPSASAGPLPPLSSPSSSTYATTSS